MNILDCFAHAPSPSVVFVDDEEPLDLPQPLTALHWVVEYEPSFERPRSEPLSFQRACEDMRGQLQRGLMVPLPLPFALPDLLEDMPADAINMVQRAGRVTAVEMFADHFPGPHRETRHLELLAFLRTIRPPTDAFVEHAIGPRERVRVRWYELDVPPELMDPDEVEA